MGKTRERVTTGIQAAKPFPEFPLFVHPSGRWAKKIRGNMVYLGSLADGWQSALKVYEANKVALHAGEIRQPRPLEDYDAPTVYDLAKKFMDAKDADLEAGIIVRTTHRNYNTTCRELIKVFGEDRTLGSIGKEDFARFKTALVKRLNANSLHALINRVRIIFNYAEEEKLIPVPMEYGADFKRPSQKSRRRARRVRGSRVLKPAELRTIIENAKQPLKAMILLGLNGGLGPSDLGQMTTEEIDWERNMIVYPRPKTEVDRRFPMWPETSKALKEAIALRQKPRHRADERLVFLTLFGNPWHKESLTSNPLSMEFKKLLERVGLYRSGVSFYSLRHCFETVAGNCRDQVAVDFIMGHVDAGMGANYRDGIDDERLQHAVDAVREWVFPPAPVST